MDINTCITRLQTTNPRWRQSQKQGGIVCVSVSHLRVHYITIQGVFFKSTKSPLRNNLGCFYWSISTPLTRYLDTLLGIVYNSQSLKFHESGPTLQPGQTCGRSDDSGTKRQEKKVLNLLTSELHVQVLLIYFY